MIVLPDSPLAIGNHINSQLMTPLADVRHRARMRERKHFTLLQPPQQEARFEASVQREGRRFDFAAQPNEWFV